MRTKASAQAASFTSPSGYPSSPLPEVHLDQLASNLQTSIQTILQERLAALLLPPTTSLLLLHLLAALYGSNTVASKVIDSSAADLPSSLITLARYAITTLTLGPALVGAAQSKQLDLLIAGSELGLQSFLGILCGAAAAKTATGSSAPLLFTFTVVVVPLMEVFAGRSVSKLTWGTTLAALSSMGLLTWGGANVHDVSALHVGDTWPLLVSALSAAQIFRAESLTTKFDPLHLTAVQLGVVTLLSAGWEAFSLATGATHWDALGGQLQDLPWGPLLYSGLVCAGLCQWAELKGLRHVHASTATLIYTTIPLWGAFLSFLVRGELPGGTPTLGAALLVCLALGGRGFRGGAFALRGLEGFEATEAAATPSSIWPRAELSTSRTSSEALPAALLSTQLKLPFYAAQAQRVLGETRERMAEFQSSLDSWSSYLLGGTAGSAPKGTNLSQAEGLSKECLPSACPGHIQGSEVSTGHSLAIADSALHSGLLATKVLAGKAEALGTAFVSESVQIWDNANEGLRTAASAEHAFTQPWITAAQPPLSWITHPIATDVATWCHLIRH